MRIGTAARLWERLEPSRGGMRANSAAMLDRRAPSGGDMELCYEPFGIGRRPRRASPSPPATLLVLPNGWVKVAAALPQVCATCAAIGSRGVGRLSRCAGSGIK